MILTLDNTSNHPLPPNMSMDELCVIYSAAILADDNVIISAEKLNTILKAANIEVEPIWPTLYAKALGGCDVKKLLTSIVSRNAQAAPKTQAFVPNTDTAPDADDKNHDEKKDDTESDDGDDLGINLFDF